VVESAYDSHAAFLRQLHFLRSLRDQYSGTILHLPADLPLNRLLSETQLPHRPVEQVEHAVARAQPMTRMQVRILDHVRFLEALRLPATHKPGKATIAIRESEGEVSRIQLELDAGRIRARGVGGDAEVECSDQVWAAIACGDIAASDAARLGLIRVTNPDALGTLDVLSVGPVPFCNERF
jgi:hypothetical protein